LGGESSAEKESYTNAMQVEHPHYTRPEDYRGLKVPDVLLSGHHGNIDKWRQENSKK
jgi:tRNA (guanine37-N1)-methyltransferase